MVHSCVHRHLVFRCISGTTLLHVAAKLNDTKSVNVSQMSCFNVRILRYSGWSKPVTRTMCRSYMYSMHLHGNWYQGWLHDTELSLQCCLCWQLNMEFDRKRVCFITLLAGGHDANLTTSTFCVVDVFRLCWTWALLWTYSTIKIVPHSTAAPGSRCLRYYRSVEFVHGHT